MIAVVQKELFVAEKQSVTLGSFINPELGISDWINDVGAILLMNGGVLLVVFSHRTPSPYDARHISLGTGQCIESWDSLCPETCLAAEAMRRGIVSTGCDLYVANFPCAPCARFWAHTGIKRLYYAEGFLHRSKVEVLKDGGVEIFHTTL